MKINSAWNNLKQAGIRAYLEKGDRGSRDERNRDENTHHLVR